MRKYAFFIVLTVLILTFMSGCAYQMGDGLLSLPKLPAEYEELQKIYDGIIGKGASFVSVTGGSNRQSVQLADLNMDGENEVVSFFRNADGTISVYVHEKTEDTYREIGQFTGVGKNIRSVEYVSANELGEKAILISWELDELSKTAMSVYMSTGETMEKVLDLEYVGYHIIDLDMDGKEDIVAICRNMGEKVMTAYVYSFNDDSCTLKASAPMSLESDKVVNISSGLTAEGKKGVFVDSSTLEGQYVTDIFTCTDGVMMNESIDSESGSAAVTGRYLNIYSTDIDNDGIVEVPLGKMFKGYTDPLSSETRWMIMWSKIQKGKVVGAPVNTFYNAVDGWYMVLPEKWGDNVTAVINNGANVNTTTFFVPVQNEDGSYTMVCDKENSILSVYTITGDTRERLSEYPDIKILKQTDTTVYAYKIYENQYDQYAVTSEDVLLLVKYVRNTDWNMEDFAQ